MGQGFGKSMRLAALALGLSGAASAGDALPRVNWVLGLGWSPEYCLAHVASKEMQCREVRYFELNGLYRDEPRRPPRCVEAEPISDARMDQLLYVVPNKATLKQIWRQEGACSGLPMDEYFVQLDRAKRRIEIPAAYQDLPAGAKTSAADIKSAFVSANEGLSEDGINLVCKGRWLSEVQICLDADFGFRRCSTAIEHPCAEAVQLRKLGPISRKRQPRD